MANALGSPSSLQQPLVSELEPESEKLAMALANSVRRVAVIGAGPSGLAAVKYAHMLDPRFA